MQRDSEQLPDARSHLPKPLERRLLRPYSDSVPKRIAASAALRALSVLVRRHPGAALSALWAGVIQGSRTGLTELKRRLPLLGHRKSNAGPKEIEETRRALVKELGEAELKRIEDELGRKAEA